MKNSIFIIFPYKYNGTWVFDDESTGLVKEPFVSGIPEIIDEMTLEIPDAEKGFKLIFSSAPFPGHKIILEKIRTEYEGTWYRENTTKKEGWLCPALFKYYDTAPDRFYIQVSTL